MASSGALTLEMMQKFADDVAQTLPSSNSECDQCGAKAADYPGWFGMRCPSSPFGSCDGRMVPLVESLQSIQRREGVGAAEAMQIQREMAAALKVYVEFFGAVHDDGCPCDDTCDCGGKVINDGVNAVVRYLEGQE